MAEDADKRAELDLQITLLAEHEITRAIHLVSALAEKWDVHEARDPEQSLAPGKLRDINYDTRRCA